MRVIVDPALTASSRQRCKSRNNPEWSGSIFFRGRPAGLRNSALRAARYSIQGLLHSSPSALPNSPGVSAGGPRLLEVGRPQSAPADDRPAEARARRFRQRCADSAKGAKGGAMRTGAPRSVHAPARKSVPRPLQGSQRPSAPVSRQTGSSCIRALMLASLAHIWTSRDSRRESGKFGPRSANQSVEIKLLAINANRPRA